MQVQLNAALLDGYLTVCDRQYQGRNHRYYAITPAGRDQLDECRRDWRDLAGQMDKISSGREKARQRSSIYTCFGPSFQGR